MNQIFFDFFLKAAYATLYFFVYRSLFCRNPECMSVFLSTFSPGSGCLPFIRVECSFDSAACSL